jgi:hypothetical protein
LSNTQQNNTFLRVKTKRGGGGKRDGGLKENRRIDGEEKAESKEKRGVQNRCSWCHESLPEHESRDSTVVIHVDLPLLFVRVFFRHSL